MTRPHGFTVIEALVVLAALALGAILYFTGQATITATARDSLKKTATNAMYYSLEEYYYPKYGYYPQSIESKALPTMDPKLFTDPDDVKLGDAGSSYHYTATDCSRDGHCKSYKLSADMEREAEYTKVSRHG